MAKDQARADKAEADLAKVREALLAGRIGAVWAYTVGDPSQHWVKTIRKIDEALGRLDNMKEE